MGGEAEIKTLVIDVFMAILLAKLELILEEIWTILERS
jgi:hypothetical protein